MEHPAAALVAGLEARIAATLDGALAGTSRLALLDFPDYANVGDSAIYLGTLAFLRRRYGVSPHYVCRPDTFSATDLGRRLGDGAVLLQGGGNFGDLWPVHQEFREVALRALRGRRVIQLPQSIHFRERDALRRAAAAIAAHGDVLLLVRDRRSADLARSAFPCEVRLCPDMAFALGALDRPAPPRHDLMLLLRDDRERAGTGTAAVPADAVRTDWPPDGGGRRALRLRRALKLAATAPRRALDRHEQRSCFYEALARRRLAGGLALLASGRQVITDRLHGHILCLLLGIPHVALDNSYGKLGGVIEAWTAGSDLLARAGDLSEALALCRRRPAA